MARFKHVSSGVVVDVPEAVGESLAGYEPVKAPAAQQKSATAKKK